MGHFQASVLALLGAFGCAGRPVAVAVSPPRPVLEAERERQREPEARAQERGTELVRLPPCEGLRGIAEATRKSFPKEQPGPELAPCLAGKGGAYSLSVKYVEDVSDGYGPGYSAELVLLHADAAGHLARSVALSAPSTATYATGRTLAGVVDYDGDGTDELLVEQHEWEFEGNGDYHAEIGHVVGDRVEEYPPAAKISIARFEDVDADGLPDLLVHTPFQGVINGCGPDGQYLEFGPKWPMHALIGGGFAFDAMSHAELLRACPARPTHIVPSSTAGVDNTELRQRLACAVAWGMPSEHIVRELVRDCPKSKAPLDECASDGTLAVCVNVPQLVKWAAEKAPFVLP